MSLSIQPGSTLSYVLIWRERATETPVNLSGATVALYATNLPHEDEVEVEIVDAQAGRVRVRLADTYTADMRDKLRYYFSIRVQFGEDSVRVSPRIFVVAKV